MAIILTDILDKKHSGPIFSKTGLITVVIIFVTFALPLFLVVNTHNYWVNTRTYLEQPDIMHMNEIMVQMCTDLNCYSFASTKNLNDIFYGTTESAT